MTLQTHARQVGRTDHQFLLSLQGRWVTWTEYGWLLQPDARQVKGD